MQIFYYLIIIFGIMLTTMAVQQWQHLIKQRALLNDKDSQATQQTDFSFIDYHAIIISNSNILHALNEIEKNLIAKLRIFGIIMAVILLLNIIGIFNFGKETFAMVGVMIFITILITPAIIIKFSIDSHIKRMMNVLPYFVDLLAVCVQSGMTVESSIKFIAERSEDLDKNLSSLMMLLVKRAEVSSMEDGLMDMYRSMEMAEIRMFSTLLQQSVHYGTSLYENLLELSKDMREAQLLASEEKIGSLSAKMSIPLIIFIMFPITILIAAPGILRIMQNANFN